MKSQKIIEYFDFLEAEDDNYQGNSQIFDDGSEALYCLLFKVLGDNRTIEELTKIFDFPTATEFKYSAARGDYRSIFLMAEEHGCELTQNGATLNVTPAAIQKIEEFLPALTERVGSHRLAKDPGFLNALVIRYN